jgi:outer membrane protein OmpA-like peptidoglycan-associated protein
MAGVESAREDGGADAAPKAKEEAEAANSRKAKDAAAEEASAARARYRDEMAAADTARASRAAAEDADVLRAQYRAEMAAHGKTRTDAETAAARKAKDDADAIAAKTRDDAARAERDATERAERDRAEREAVEAAAAQKAKQEADQAAEAKADAEAQAAAAKAAQERKTNEHTERCQKRLAEAAGRDTILFERASADIDPKSAVTIAKLSEIVKSCPGMRIEVEGHTDSEGAADRNQNLSERRAKAVVKSLVYAGVDESRLSAVGYGATRPIAPNDTPEGMAQNRRIEFKVFSE